MWLSMQLRPQSNDRIPALSAGRLDRRWLDGGLGAAQALGAPGRGASVWAAAVVGLAAVEGGGRAVRVLDRVGLGRGRS